MYELPISIFVEDEEYKIRNSGDYRMVLDCLEALEDTNLKPLERIYSGLIIFYEDFVDVDDILNVPRETVEELIEKMFLFFNLNEETDDSQKEKPKLVNWQADEALIISAINHVAGKEVRAEAYIHWWTFIAYYMAIGECSLSTVVGIRDKIAKGKKLEKHEKEFRANNPKYFNNIDLRTKSQKANDEWARSVWNRGKG